MDVIYSLLPCFVLCKKLEFVDKFQYKKTALARIKPVFQFTFKLVQKALKLKALKLFLKLGTLELVNEL